MTEAKRKRGHGVDTYEQIAICLNCPYPECRDACTPGVRMPAHGRNLRKRLDENGYGLSLLRKGLSDRDIGDLMDATATAVGKWRRARGFPPGSTMRKEKTTCSA